MAMERESGYAQPENSRLWSMNAGIKRVMIP